MAFGLKTKDGVVLMFTITTSISESHNGVLPEHPLESGASINDHVVVKPERFSVKGLFLASDFNAEQVDDYLFMTSLVEGVSLQYVGAAPVLSTNVEVLREAENRFASLLPEGLQAFATKPAPSVSVANNLKPTSLQGIKQLLTAWQKEGTQLSGLLFDNGLLSELTTDLGIVDIALSEDPDSGDALVVDLTLAKIRYVTLGKQTVPTLTWKEIDLTEKGANNKGQQQGKGNGATQENPDQPPAGEEGMLKCVARGANGEVLGQQLFTNCLIKESIGSLFDFAGGL